MSASLATNNTTTGFRTSTTRFIIKSNQMEASSLQPTNQVADFLQSPNFATRQQQQGSSNSSGASCNVGELLKLTNLKLNDEASPTSSRENLNLTNLNNNSDNTNNSPAVHQHNNRRLTGGSRRMLLNFDERPPNRASGSMEHEQQQQQHHIQQQQEQQMRRIPVTPFTGMNPSQNFTTYESLSTLSQQQHRHHSRFVNNNNYSTTTTNYPTFVDHHHQQPQQQVFACNEVVFESSGDAVVKTSTKTTTTTSENISTANNEIGTTNSNEQTTNLEYLELDGVCSRASPTVAAAVAAASNQHQAAELSFSSITLADNQYKTSRNYAPLDSVTTQYPLLDCVTTELSEVINEDYRNQHESLHQYHQGGDSSLRNSYKHHHHQDQTAATADQREQILLLQQQDSGHASSISCVDSAGSVSFNETSQRSAAAAGANQQRGGYSNGNNNYASQQHQHQLGDQYITGSDNNLRSSLSNSNYHHHQQQQHNYNQYSSYIDQDHHHHLHHHQDNNNHHHQQQQQQQPQHYSQLNSELLNSEPDLKVCEWEGCENTFLDMQEFVKHLEDKHVNQAPREKNRYFCLWSNCKRNEQEFNARYKLLIHMRVHSGEKPYPCNNENCKKSFSRLENLKIHVRSHTGEKPYKCNFSNCSKSFTNSSDRIKHHKTHRDPKPYSCNFNSCAKRYTDPSSLRKHLRTHKARTSGASCSGAETMGVVGAANPSIQVSVLTSDFDPNSFLDQVSPLQHQHRQPSSSETTTTTANLALNPSSSGQFIDPNESYIYNSHGHSQASSGAISNVNQATGSNHSTYYQNYHNQLQTPANHNQELQFQHQQHHDHDNNNNLQQQHLQFSRSWCAGYTAVRPSNVSGSNPSLTGSELSSNHVHAWNQASSPGECNTGAANFTNSTATLDSSSGWLSSQNVVVYGSPPRYTNNKFVLEQHENLMRSLPHTSSSGTLNRNPFGGQQQQRAIGENLRARFESWNQNSNAHAQVRGRRIEEDRNVDGGEVERENNNNNTNQKQRFSRANYSMDQVAQ